jgi:cytochrome d ubiquinol oxidase subunit I
MGDIVTLSQVQFAMTSIFHFIFVPITMGLSILIAIMESIYVRSGKTMYRDMARFWGNLFVINFALGVVTGIVQEFHFGLNWAGYSRFVGDIFGAPLAVEALLAFFMESVFLGVWIFGWERVSKGVHLTAMWLVAIGANISALWILAANSFMQEPVGYALEGGRAVMTNFTALITNPNLLLMFPHTLFAALCTAGFFMLGISAYHLARKNEVPFFAASFRIAAITAVVATVGVIAIGHSQAQHMVASQPMKMAVADAVVDTQDPAPLSVITIVDPTNLTEVFSIRVPYLLSLLAYNRPYGAVQGMRDLQASMQQQYGPGNYVPPIGVNYWSFRIMVGVGFLMLALSIYGLVKVLRDPDLDTMRYKGFFLAGIAFPYIANTTGWLLTEMGRQPWIVYGLLKTADAVSPNLTPGMVMTTLVGFGLVYLLLIALDVYLMVRSAKAGPAPVTTGETEEQPAL